MKDNKNESESHYRSSSKNLKYSDKERYKSIIETSPNGIITVNTKGTITSANPNFVELTGYPKEEIIGSHFTKLSTIPLADIPKYLKMFQAVMRGGKPPKFKYSYKRKDGEIHWAEASYGIIKKNGRISEMQITCREITEEKKAEEALKASQEKYASLIELSPIGILTIDTKGNITSCNKKILDFTGYTRKELIGESFTRLKILKVKNIARLLKMLAQAIKGRKIQNFEISWQHKNGTPYIGEARYSTIKEKGKSTGFQMIVMDITEREEAKKSLKESERRFRELFNRMSSGVAVYETVNDGEDFIFKDFNKASEEINGIKKKDLIGKSVLKVFPGVREFGLFDVFKRVYKTGNSEHHSTSFYKDYRITGRIENYVYKLPSGEVVAVYDDVTDKKIAEEKIKYLSFHDKLTNLYNRAYFEEELTRLNTPRQLPLSIIMGDLNGLKLINDTFGYSRGDRLLVDISKVLKDVCRADDILARWGGDEFVILLPKTTQSDAEEITARIKGTCKKTSTKKIPLSISLGISTKKNPSQDIFSILKEAEDRMQNVKLLESRSIVRSIIYSIENLLAEKSDETKLHTERIRDMSERLGRVTGLSASQMDKLSLLATLHDIGKIAVPQDILKKRGALTEKEWDTLKRHPETGYRIASATPELAHIADDILSCHERFNGTGYPHSLKGEDIPILSRIILIVDAYDVMTHDREYKKAMTKDGAIEELKRCSGTQFDTKLVEKFIEIISDLKY